MRQISEGIYGLLVSQGIANGRAGTRANGGKIARTAGTGAAGIGAGDQSGGTNRLLTGLREGGDRNPMGMGKGTPAETGAKSNREVSANAQEPSPSREEARPVPRIVIDNSRNWRTQAPRVAPLGVRQFLVLVQ